MALSKDVVIRLLGDSDSAVRATKAAADAAEVSVTQYRRAEREQQRQADTARRAAQAQQDSMDKVGRGALVFGAVVAAGLALSTRAAIDWESAWAGVQKTVDGTPEQMNELEASLRGLATTLPATHDEIAGVAEAAGQLGIARGDIVEFTEVAIALGVSTNLSAEDAATGLARLSNIMGTSSSDVDRMGSSLVALGNAGASTEGEILDMALRIGAAGRQAGFTEGEVLGLANAMSSLGIESEAGGTAISSVIKDINSSVLDGGDQLEAYAEVAGMTAEQFATAWRTDASGALVSFVEGLGRVQESGGNVNTTLSDLGFNGIRVSDTLLRLAGDSEGLAASLTLGNDAWAANTALMNEANQRYETSASKIQIAQNSIEDAGITIGSILLPALAAGVGLVADFAQGFAELPDWMQDAVTIIGVLAAGIGLLGGAAIIAWPKIAAFRAEMTLLATSGSTAAAGVGRFATFMTGPWGAAIGIATIALGGLITWLGSSNKATDAAVSYQEDLASALRDSGGAIDDNVRALAARQAALKDDEDGSKSLLELTEQMGGSLPRVTDALLGNRDAYDELVQASRDYEQAALDRVNGNTEDASFVAATEAAQQYRTELEAQANAMGGAIADNERLAAATEESGGAAEGAIPGLQGAADATGDLGGAAEDAKTAADELADALDNLNGPTLNLRDATRQYEESIDAITDAMGEDGWTGTMDVATEQGRKNQAMLDDLASSAMDQANAIMGSSGSYDAFRGSLEASREQLVQSAIDMGMSEEAAWALADQILQIPEQTEVSVTMPTYGTTRDQINGVQQQLGALPPNTPVAVQALTATAEARLAAMGYTVTHLPDGTVQVSADTGTAQTSLDNFVNQRRTVTVNVATVYSNPGTSVRAGSGVPGFAEGGTTPSMAPYWVGENGPELHFESESAFIATAAQSRAIADSLRQPTQYGTPLPGSAGAPGYAAGAAVIDIDYRRLAAALSGGQRAVVEVAQMIVPDRQSATETAEALAYIGRTRGA